MNNTDSKDAASTADAEFAAKTARDEEKHQHLLENASPSFTKEEFATALSVLATIANDRGALSTVDKLGHQELQFLTGKVARPDAAARKKLQRARRRAEKAAKREADDQLRQDSEIRRKRLDPVFVTPPGTSALAFESSAPALLGTGEAPAPEDEATSAEGELNSARRCYVCKREYKTLHSFYDQLCSDCGDLNVRKRAPAYDLTGRTALITGGRVKIGYHAAILMLRNGCHVVVSTRFPNDAAARFAKEPDFEDWKERLDLYGLDLRHTPSVEQFCDFLNRDLETLDFVIHNACQTVRRPPDFYSHMLEGEQRSLSQLPAAERSLVEKYAALRTAAGSGLSRPAELSQAATDADGVGMGSLKALEESVPESLKSVVSLFPQGRLDADLQQVDLRTHNSWRLTLDEVPTIELLEVLLVNAVAPFVLSGRLRPLMTRVQTDDKHIVNVSAMEGQFHRNKTDKHPHTNMAKAALNMLTRTSAQDYVRDGIHMNAVDTGWITDEDPAHIAQRKIDMHQFSPPLDVVDGAARIVDPIFDGLTTGKHAWGQFLKDYAPTYW